MDIKSIFKNNKFRISFTILLLLVESVIGILLPLFIGFAVDGAIQSDFNAVYQLGGLSLALILIGGFRRLYDSRFYAKLYIQMSNRLINNKGNPMEVSVKTARLNMLTEITEFMENQIPELLQHSIGLVGVAFIILSLNLNIFLCAASAGILVMIVYWLSSKKTIQHNRNLNNEMEAQVQIVTNNYQQALQQHIRKLTQLNIKLSDLETINFSLSWLLMSVFLLLSIVIAVAGGVVQYGALFALIMYVYQYIESVVSLPLYYQQWLRLKEIYGRLKQI